MQYVLWEGDDWNTGIEMPMEKEETQGNRLICRGHLLHIKWKEPAPITWSVSCSYLLSQVLDSLYNGPRVPLLSSQTHSPNRRPWHLCLQLPVASELTGSKSSFWSLLEARASLGCLPLDVCHDPAKLAPTVLKPLNSFLPQGPVSTLVSLWRESIFIRGHSQ